MCSCSFQMRHCSQSLALFITNSQWIQQNARTEFLLADTHSGNRNQSTTYCPRKADCNAIQYDVRRRELIANQFHAHDFSVLWSPASSAKSRSIVLIHRGH